MKILLLLTFLCFALIEFVYSGPPPVILTVTSATPDPVVAGNNLTIFVDSSDPTPAAIGIDLNCGLLDGLYTANTFEYVQLLVPINFSGRCGINVGLLSGYSVQNENGSQIVDVLLPMTWTSPTAHEYFLTDTQAPIYVYADTSDTSPLIISLLKDSVLTYLNTTELNVLSSALIPISYPRGPADLIALPEAVYVEPNSTLSIFVNTTVECASPSDGESFFQNSQVAVEITAYDGLSTTCSVKMTCSYGYSVTQIVRSTSAAYFVSPLPGTCSLDIIAVADEYVVIASSPVITINILPFSNPSGGFVFPLTSEQISAFASSVSLSSLSLPLPSCDSEYQTRCNEFF